MDTDLAFKLAELRDQIAELGSSIRQLQKAGMDSASAQLLIARKRAELERLMNSNGATATAVDKGARRRSAPAGRGGNVILPSAVMRAAHRSRIRALQK